MPLTTGEHRPGDSWDFDKDRGENLPHGHACGISIHRYPEVRRRDSPSRDRKKGTAIFCCPDVETINVSKSNESMKRKRLISLF